MFKIEAEVQSIVKNSLHHKQHSRQRLLKQCLGPEIERPCLLLLIIATSCDVYTFPADDGTTVVSRNLCVNAFISGGVLNSSHCVFTVSSALTLTQFQRRHIQHGLTYTDAAFLPSPCLHVYLIASPDFTVAATAVKTRRQFYSRP